MKKLLFTVLFLTVFAVAAWAQAPQPFSLYAGGALSLPAAPDGFKEGYKTGFHGSIGFGYKAAPNTQIVAKVEHHQFPIDYDSNPLLSTLTGVEGGANKMWMFGVDARMSFALPSSPVKPFVLGGLGMAKIQQSEFSGSNTLATSTLNSLIQEDQNKMYFNLGAGVELKAGPAWSLFAQLRYVSIATEGESSSFVPVTLGVKFF